MNTGDYENHDGLALAGLLERGEVDSTELMDCAIALAEQRNPALNFLIHSQFETSRRIAAEWAPRGAFRGIPFLLKDSGFAHRRFPSSIGSRLFRDTVFDFDATVANRFESAGFIPFARTTVPELCMAGTTDAARNGGATLNPWDRRLSAGGSSGGAAAAVAARVVPVAHGSDGGGSIRIPAACCGVYGLKPSRGRVPMGPSRGEGWAGMSTDGVLSISVRDTAAALDAIGGYEPGAPYAAPPQAGSYLEAVREQHIVPMRVGVLRRAWNGIAIAPECDAAVDFTVSLLEGLGHQVVELAPPPIDYDGFVHAHGSILAGNIVVAVHNRMKVLGRVVREDELEPVILDGWHVGQALDAAAYIDAVSRLHAVGRAFATAMADVDLLLTPTLTQLPCPVDYLSLAGGDRLGFRAYRQRAASYSTFLPVINGAGIPAASLPLHWTDREIPVATQLIGHFGREDTVLTVSAQLERAAPWAHHRPKFG
ncbi:amidase [Xylophilus sp. GOD-11R]|uniref:amidase n=1 Tax=Xylophilus sp. GOD-11R TaxID=3089814 RepID=UPI00298C21D3|nr:amidase [Xylophilus sp. GOD-11R]WPB56317.1 amidase [Xylophilus sp. GOD-11R]